MAETFRAPKAVQSEVEENRGLVAADKIQAALSLEDVIEMRQSWQGENGREWANQISASVEERAAQLTKGSTTMSEIRDGIYGADSYGVPQSILAADASIDAAQDLLQQIMNDDPVAAQAYHLLCAADLALDPVIKAMGLSDPDEDSSNADSDEDTETESAVIRSADEVVEVAETTEDVEAVEETDEDRAAASRIGEGTFVSWPTSKGRARGKVETVMTRGTATSSDGYSIEGTPDNPAFHVRVYREQGNGWVASDQVNVHRSNYLTIIKPLQSPRSADISMVEERKAAIRTAERITMTAELRAVGQDDDNFKIAGYAATFNAEATGLNFREMIAPGAFTRTLQSDNPVFFLINHDTESLPLASTQSGTLRLSEDSTGLRMEADLDMKNPRAQELASAIERGDVNKMSFAFSVADNGQTKEDGLRTLTDLDLFEVSAVTWPAYDSTTLSPRSADAALDTEDLDIRKRQLAAKFNQYSLRRKR